MKGTKSFKKRWDLRIVTIVLKHIRELYENPTVSWSFWYSMSYWFMDDIHMLATWVVLISRSLFLAFFFWRSFFTYRKKNYCTMNTKKIRFFVNCIDNFSQKETTFLLQCMKDLTCINLNTAEWEIQLLFNFSRQFNLLCGF